MSSNKPSKHVNEFPAALIKNIRAVAAVKCYDLLSQHESTKQEDQWRFMFNCFHGNNDKNIVSQIQMLLCGGGVYENLYTRENPCTITDRNTGTDDTVNTNDAGVILVLKSRYSNNKRYVAGINFTIDSLSSPTKKRLGEKITGRNIYDLALATIKNIKKAMDTR